MNRKNHHIQRRQEGITLLITILLMGVLLSIGTALLNVTLKQFQLAGIMLSSEIAFQAASAIMECTRSKDVPGSTEFAVPTLDETPKTITCMGDVMSSDSSNTVGVDPVDEQGEEQSFQFDWGINGQEVCSEVTVMKFFNPNADETMTLEGAASRTCSAGAQCTIVQARGYNVGCSERDDGGRVVEREFVLVY